MEKLVNSPPMGLKEIGRIVEEKGFRCSFCNNPIKAVNIRSKDHDDGIWVKGFIKKQWVYFLCFRCFYEWSLSKILGN